MPASEFIPDYLKPFIAKQDASLYTPIDHASWRFILRVSRDFFKKNAHPKYLSGLEETGISAERIPLISEMDEKLKRFGWRAVAVSGFIPPSVFMEFQSLGILPIACEMRTLEHLAYTPAPDIVHEAAGHAPIIVDPEYAAYLRAYGDISRKAIFSYQDMDVYEAVRTLSIVKEDPASTASDIELAQKGLDHATASVTYLSEATYMARMNWWTVEYGLVGALDNPKIYGAGLLSSLGESYHCLNAEVKKIPLSLKCIDQSYDITKPQPQLFVTSDFKHLTDVLHEFAGTMAFKTGGKSALEKGIQAKTVCTALLDSGIQISGIIESFREIEGRIAFLKTSGPTQLSFNDVELENQGPDYHREGFSTVIGKVISETEMSGKTRLIFESNIEVVGKKEFEVARDGKRILIRFTDCTIKTPDGELLYQPAWGPCDLACGENVTSVFGGAADRKNFLAKTGGFKQSPMLPKCNLTPENRDLNKLYAEVRSLRESGQGSIEDLSQIGSALESKYPEDWLLILELLEISEMRKLTLPFEKELHDRLAEIKRLSLDREEMISRGLALLSRGI